MPVTVKSLATVFDEWWNKQHLMEEECEDFWIPILNTYGFKLRVVVSKDIPPRHSTFSWIRGLGVSKFDEIFQGEVKLPTNWLLAFPERHISLDEQRKLIYQLCKLNKEQGYPMKKLDILTSSPYIISDCKSEIISIIGFKDGKPTYDQDYMSF